MEEEIRALAVVRAAAMPSSTKTVVANGSVRSESLCRYLVALEVSLERVPRARS